MHLNIKPTAQHPKFAVFGPNVYGIGDTIDKAKKNAESANGRRKLTKYLVYAIGPKTTIDPGMGDFLTDPNDDGSYTQPKLLAKVDGQKVEIEA